MRQATANVMFDFIGEVARAATSADILEELGRAANEFGMERFAISGIPAPHERIDPYFILNAWPDEWFTRYLSENYVHIDPVIQKTKHSDDAFVWSEALARMPVGPKGRRIMGEATEFGMNDGFSVPLHGLGGFQAIVTFGSRKVDLSLEQRGALQLIATFAHNRLRAIISCESVERSTVASTITKREREVIHWCAAGKTNWEIAQILGRSEKTVQHLLARAQYKFNAVNRTQLIAESIRHGVIR